jgi:hypothetical protein
LALRQNAFGPLPESVFHSTFTMIAQLRLFRSYIDFEHAHSAGELSGRELFRSKSTARFYNHGR